MAVSEATYKALVLEDRESNWELVCGRLRRKPVMTARHNDVARSLVGLVVPQVSLREFRVDAGTARLRISTGTYYVPDFCVIPRAMVEEAKRLRPTEAETYADPVPLVMSGRHGRVTMMWKRSCRSTAGAVMRKSRGCTRWSGR